MTQALLDLNVKRGGVSDALWLWVVGQVWRLDPTGIRMAIQYRLDMIGA